MTAKLLVEEFTVYRSVIGDDYEPAEESFPYSLDTSIPADVKSPDEFPTILERFLGVRAPGVNPVAEFVRKLDERKKQK